MSEEEFSINNGEGQENVDVLDAGEIEASLVQHGLYDIPAGTRVEVIVHVPDSTVPFSDMSVGRISLLNGLPQAEFFAENNVEKPLIEFRPSSQDLVAVSREFVEALEAEDAAHTAGNKDYPDVPREDFFNRIKVEQRTARNKFLDDNPGVKKLIQASPLDYEKVDDISVVVGASRPLNPLIT